MKVCRYYYAAEDPCAPSVSAAFTSCCTRLIAPWIQFAKMEMNMLLAFFVAKFDYQLVEADGTPTTRVPEIDNEAWAVHKVEDPVYFKLSERSA